MDNSAHRRRPEESEAGWTFIETLLVIGIMMILTSAVSIAGTKLMDRAKETSVRYQMSALAAALEMYRLDCSRYPTDDQGLKALWEKPALEPIPEKWDGPYTSRPPGDDPWGAEYEYRCPGPEGLPFGIRCLGADGRMGGAEDDIVSWE